MEETNQPEGNQTTTSEPIQEQKPDVQQRDMELPDEIKTILSDAEVLWNKFFEAPKPRFINEACASYLASFEHEALQCISSCCLSKVLKFDGSFKVAKVYINGEKYFKSHLW